MGTAASRACRDCEACLIFLKLSKKHPKQYLELVDIQYLTNNPKQANELNTPSSVSTVSSVSTIEFLEYYDSPLELNFEKIIDKEGYLVYAQDFDEGFIIKARWFSNFTPKQILSYFRMNEERKKWDKNIDSIEEIPGECNDEFYTYSRFKKVMVISQRDMMIVSNIFERSDGIMVVSRSCDHEMFPEDSNFVRMKIFLAGYYFQELKDEQYQTKVFMLMKANFGGSTPTKLVKKSTAMTIPKLYQGMESCMKAYYS